MKNKISAKAMFIAYHDLSTEARSIEMLQALEMVFEKVICICRNKPIYGSKAECFSPKKTKFQYINFLIDSYKYLDKFKPAFLVLHDEFTSPLITKAKRVNPNMCICYDSSELNIDRKLPGLKNKISRILYAIERRKIIEADLVFAANQERADIMKQEFQLKKRIEVFDNIHRIDDEYNEKQCNEKYGDFFAEKKTLVYGGGIAHGRYTFELIECFKNSDEFNLLIAGSATKQCQNEFNNIIESQNIKNIHYLGFVPRAEWRYLLERAIASFILFKADCPNTKYCASGKLYESLFLGTPIICSYNPPLMRLCNQHRVGICTSNFLEGAKHIARNREFYKEKIQEFVNTIDYDNRIINLSNVFREIYKEIFEKEVKGKAYEL